MLHWGGAICASSVAKLRLMPMEETDKTRVFRTSDRIELSALADHLEQHGVEAHTVGENAIGGAYGVAGVDQANDLEIWTSEADSQRAAELIDQWNREHHPSREELQLPLRYSLKSLLLLMSLVAVACAISATLGLQWIAILLGLFELVLFLDCLLVYVRRMVGKARNLQGAAPHDSTVSTAGEPNDK